jgi:hypothetical protein
MPQSKRITLTFKEVNITAIVRDTPTAKAILDALPIRSSVQTWGKEVYFSVPVQTTLEEDAKDVINPGEIAFWVEGSCIAIGFGPTPISHGDEIRLAAATNIWADTNDDVRQLVNIKSQDTVIVDWA